MRGHTEEGAWFYFTSGAQPIPGSCFYLFDFWLRGVFLVA